MNAVATLEGPSPLTLDVAIRMADEGIPVLAIARATHIPSDDIYQALRAAIARGSILEMPKDDWPPKSGRGGRAPTPNPLLQDEQQLRCACTRYFKATPLEAAMLSLMLKRDEVTKEQLHAVVENARPPGREITEIKIVDVMICKLRKKIKDFDIEITTMWGVGYYIGRPFREHALGLLLSKQEA